MSVTLYGISGSRAIRSIWAAEESGVEFEHVATHFVKDSKEDAFLAVNPNGRIPALVDGELLLCESMAINLYLAKTYGGELYPQEAAEEALAWQWSLWGISEIEPLQMQIVVQKLFTREEKRKADVIERAEKALRRPMDVLNTLLEKQQFLLGEQFTIADLNVAGVMLLLEAVNFDTTQWPHAHNWLLRCYGRESLARARARD